MSYEATPTPISVTSRSRGRRAFSAALATVMFLCDGQAAFAQTPSQADRYTVLVERICLQYAAAQTGMPPDLMFKQCMSERRCRVSAEPSGYQCELPGPMTWHGGGY